MSLRATLWTASAALTLLTALPAAAETIAITHARIETMGPAGEIASGTVVVRDGRILAVGAGVPVPSDARVIDAGGRIVTPGIAATDTSLGADEVEGEKTTHDADGASDDLSAAFDVSLGVNPASMLIPVARMGGVTHAVIVPELARHGDKGASLFAGQAAVIDLSGSANSLVRRQVALAVDVDSETAEHLGGSHAGVLQTLEADLEEAASYAANKGGYERGTHRPYRQSREDLEALIPVIQGRLPLLVGVHRVADIRRVLDLGRRLKLKLILSGVEEGWMMAGEIAAAGVPVLVNPQTDLPAQFESLNARMENAGLLNAAGVTVVVVPPHVGNYARQVRYNAGYGAAHGLPWAAALASITSNPAKVFGYAEKAGSIEVGRDADLVVWSGDPLEMLTVPEHVLIGGVERPLTSRAQDLARRYLVLNPDQPPAYRQ